MSEVNTATASGGFRTLFSKRIKIGNVSIPVILIVAAIGVAILAVVAYRMRDSSLNAAGDDTTADTTDDTSDIGAADTSGLTAFTDTGGGTVYANTSGFGGDTGAVSDTGTVSDTSSNASITSNDAWVTKGTNFLVTKGISGGDALQALSTYVDGGQLSYEQGTWRDMVIKEYGPPPDPFVPGGTNSAPIVLRQGNPPLVHTVKYPGKDDTYTALVSIYYGQTTGVIKDDSIDLIQAANINLGHNGPFPTGTKVTIPAWHTPKFYTVVSGVTTAAQIAAKNGISVAQLSELNDQSPGQPKVTFPAKVGSKVRVA